MTGFYTNTRYISVQARRSQDTFIQLLYSNNILLLLWNDEPFSAHLVNDPPSIFNTSRHSVKLWWDTPQQGNTQGHGDGFAQRIMTHLSLHMRNLPAPRANSKMDMFSQIIQTLTESKHIHSPRDIKTICCSDAEDRAKTQSLLFWPWHTLAVQSKPNIIR